MVKGKAYMYLKKYVSELARIARLSTVSCLETKSHDASETETKKYKGIGNKIYNTKST